MTRSRQNPEPAPQLSRNDLDPLERARLLSAATLHEAAGQHGALPSQIKPVGRQQTICGPAFTVQLEPGDNLALHHAVHQARPGEILVAAARGYFEAGYWGEILSTAAAQRKLGGLIIDGCVRDGAALAKQIFPVFARGLCLQGTTKHGYHHRVLAPVVIGEVVIEPGDIVVGDADGVVVISLRSLDEVVHRAERREHDERLILQKVAAGVPTLDALGLEQEQPEIS